MLGGMLLIFATFFVAGAFHDLLISAWWFGNNFRGVVPNGHETRSISYFNGSLAILCIVHQVEQAKIIKRFRPVNCRLCYFAYYRAVF